MHELDRGTVEQRLISVGFNEASARHLASFVMSEFCNADNPQPASETELNDTLATIAYALVTSRRTIQRRFGLVLPERAPARWMNLTDRLPNETPIAFLDRVWGKYIRAGLLYQADIRRLGDRGLCTSVHGYCQQHKLRALDYLPPPHKVKLDRAALSAEPGSADAKFVKRRLEQRDRTWNARTPRTRRRPAPSP